LSKGVERLTPSILLLGSSIKIDKNCLKKETGFPMMEGGLSFFKKGSLLFMTDMMNMTDSLQLESPAKVNLRLEILKRRQDGYHELRTIFQKISLHDTLHFSLRREKGISITADHPKLPLGKKNLVYKAVQSMFKACGYRGGVLIEIEKKIPLGAGLGGGSSNAATTLMALNQLLEMNLSKKELMEMGLGIGADVPFFFLKSAAIGSGVGERLKKEELPALWYVLIYPNFEVSARWAYRHFVLTNQQFHINLHRFLKTPEGISRILFNHLEEVVSKKYPEITLMKEYLLSAGALGALMTGSGPTVFGLFPEAKRAAGAYVKIRKLVGRKGWVVFEARGITG
jgi:4-diphosphocytidyl-2-C-methyl-D-erythritol kinase